MATLFLTKTSSNLVVHRNDSTDHLKIAIFILAVNKNEKKKEVNEIEYLKSKI
jgi:hypothetical protein